MLSVTGRASKRPQVLPACEQALAQQADVARLEGELVAEKDANQRLSLFEAEVARLEAALAMERAHASDNRANLEAQVCQESGVHDGLS